SEQPLNLDALEQAFAGDPATNASRLAGAYLEAGRPGDAIRVLGSKRVNLTAEMRVLLAQAHFDSFQPERAHAILEEARRGNLKGLAENARYHALAGELAASAGATEVANEHFSHAARLEPGLRRDGG